MTLPTYSKALTPRRNTPSDLAIARHLLLTPSSLAFGVLVMVVAFIWIGTDQLWRDAGATVMLGLWVWQGGEDPAAYRVLNLGTGHMTLHRRLHALVTAMLTSVALVIKYLMGSPAPWWVPVIVGCCFLAAMVWPVTAIDYRSTDERVQNMATSTSGKTKLRSVGLPATPLGQIVWATQIRGWMLVWAVIAVVAVIVFLGSAIWDSVEVAIPAGSIAVLSGSTAMSASMFSGFREFLTLGGTRTQWATHTALVSMVNVVPTALLCGVLAFFRADAGQMVLIVLLALVAPTIAAQFSIATVRTVFYPILVGVGFVALIAARSEGVFGDGVLIGVATALFVSNFVVLRWMARRANPWTGGLENFFGLKKGA